ncbi:MAG: IS66 family transposase [Pseudomonadota bacterium]|nr:IS66 family transposase [Pseudomonadota bacterium]
MTLEDLTRQLIAQNEALVAQVEVLVAENAALKVRVAELERRLGLDSSNSGKPPSSDGFKTPPRTSSLRGKSGKKSGGQKGHKGETLKRTAHPDKVRDHFPGQCGGCGAALPEDASTGHDSRQVFDLPEPQPLETTEHRAHSCRCAHCGVLTKAAFPEGVTAPVQYGPRIAATVAYLYGQHFLPEDRLADLMADLFGAPVSAATIGAMTRRCAGRLDGFVADLLARIKKAPVKHLDETGFRIGGKRQWLHVISTEGMTHYRTDAKRGDLLDGVFGIVVHDHWKPYYKMENVEHVLCNAHHLRELKALIDIEKEDWARHMAKLLREACHAAHLEKPPGPDWVQAFERRYDKIVADGLAFHEALPPLDIPKKKRRGKPKRRIGHNLLIRLQERKSDVLRFLHEPAVPFTNNQAERDVRMMKVKQKIAGGFRSKDGANNFAILRSAISTARKQGWNILDALTQPTHVLSARIQTA